MCKEHQPFTWGEFKVMLFKWYFCLIPSFLGEKGLWKGKDCVEEIINGGGSLSIDLIKEAGNFFLRAKILSACGVHPLQAYMQLISVLSMLVGSTR